MKFTVILGNILLIRCSKEIQSTQSNVSQDDLSSKSDQANQNTSEQIEVKKTELDSGLSSDQKTLLPGEKLNSVPSIQSNENFIQLPPGDLNLKMNLQTSPNTDGRSANLNPLRQPSSEENQRSRELTPNIILSNQNNLSQNLETALNAYPVFKKILTKLAEPDNLDTYSPNLVIMLKEHPDIKFICATLLQCDNLQSLPQDLDDTFDEDFNLKNFLSEFITDDDLRQFHEEMKLLMQENTKLTEVLAVKTKSVHVETLSLDHENLNLESQNTPESRLPHASIDVLNSSSLKLQTSSNATSGHLNPSVKKSEVIETKIADLEPESSETQNHSRNNSRPQGDDPGPIEPKKTVNENLVDSEKNRPIIGRENSIKDTLKKNKKKPTINGEKSKLGDKILYKNPKHDENANNEMDIKSKVNVTADKNLNQVLNDPKGFYHTNNRNSLSPNITKTNEQKVALSTQYENLNPLKPENVFYGPKIFLDKDLPGNSSKSQKNMNGKTQNEKHEIFNNDDLNIARSGEIYKVVGKHQSYESQQHVTLTFTINRSTPLINDVLV